MKLVMVMGLGLNIGPELDMGAEVQYVLGIVHDTKIGFELEADNGGGVGHGGRGPTCTLGCT